MEEVEQFEDISIEELAEGMAKHRCRARGEHIFLLRTYDLA